MVFVLLFIVSFSSFSQDNNGKDNFIDLFPNPAKDHINIKLINDKLLEDYSFSIHSLIGNKIDFNSEILTENEMKIYVEKFNQGFFFLLVDDKINNKRKIVKFLKN